MEVIQAEITDQVTSGADQTQADQAVSHVLAETENYPVRLTNAGYLQYIDPETMLTLALEKDLLIRLLRKPGHFVRPGAALATIWPASRVDEQTVLASHMAAP